MMLRYDDSGHFGYVQRPGPSSDRGFLIWEVLQFEQLLYMLVWANLAESLVMAMAMFGLRFHLRPFEKYIEIFRDNLT